MKTEQNEQLGSRLAVYVSNFCDMTSGLLQLEFGDGRDLDFRFEKSLNSVFDSTGEDKSDNGLCGLQKHSSDYTLDSRLRMQSLSRENLPTADYGKLCHYISEA